MSVRKKRMIFMVVGVILCCLIVLFLGERAMRSDQEEYARKCKSYEGIWKSKNRDFSLEVHRVSSGTLFFSLNNRKTFQELRLLAAQAVDDDIYEFSYGVEATGFGRIYEIRPGQEAKGTISLREKEIAIDFPAIPDKKKGLEYKGVLSKKGELPEQKSYHLTDYLGTAKKATGELSKYCSFGYDDEGKVWRVHAMLSEYGEAYKTDIQGISMNSSLAECEYLLGDMTSETDLMWGGYRRTYENSDYVSTVITNEYGVIVELDCQLANLPGTTRQGDFLMKGDTAYRFTGDYSQGGSVELPQNTKRIASGAFDAGEHCYTYMSTRKYYRNIDIPSSVFVEEYAFANCGPLHIALLNGWKKIPKRAFAHLVPVDMVRKKEAWVKIILPASLEKIEEEAFALGESTEELDQLWRSFGEYFTQMPVAVDASAPMARNLRYVGDNAFWGIAMPVMPGKAEYLGANYTYYSRDYDYLYDTLNIPSQLSVLKKDSLYVLQNVEGMTITFPASLKDIEEGAIRGNVSDIYRLQDETSRTARLQKKVDGEVEWILSKDEKILYAADSVWGTSDGVKTYAYYDGEYLYTDSKPSIHYQCTKKGEIILTVPEGIEEIRNLANLQGCDKIIFPKSLKKMSFDSLFDGSWSEIVFQGAVPEITGNKKFFTQDEEKCEISGTIKVKKGKKKEMLRELVKGKNYTPEEIKKIASHIKTR